MQLKIKVLKFTKYLYINYVVVIAILTSNILLSQDNNTINKPRNCNNWPKLSLPKCKPNKLRISPKPVFL